MQPKTSMLALNQEHMKSETLNLDSRIFYHLALRSFLAIAFITPTLNASAQAPTLSIQPRSQYVPFGTSRTLTATAFGGSTLSYQWQFASNTIPGATGTTFSGNTLSFSITNAQFSNAGAYRIIVTNSVGTVTSSNATIAVGNIAAWTSATFGSSPSTTNIALDATNVVAIASYGSSCFALKSDSTVTAWGSSSFTSVPVGLSNVIAISAGPVAAKSDGTVVVWGGGPAAPADLSNVVAVAGFGNPFMALKSDGSVRVWTSLSVSPQIQTNVPFGLRAVAIERGPAASGGAGSCLAITPQGTVVSWGNATTTPPAGLSNVVAVAAGSQHGMALKSDGTVAVWGSDPVTNIPAAATNIVAIAAGDSCCLALRQDGVLLGWGSSPELAVPAGFTNIISIAAGSDHTVARRNFGEPVLTAFPGNQNLWATQPLVLNALAAGAQPLSYQWQFNGTDIPGATNASFNLASLQQSNAGSYTLIVSNAFGVVTSKVANVTVRQQVSIAFWGGRSFAATLPTNLKNVVGIATHTGHGLALFDNGGVSGWGSASYESVKPASVSNIVAIAAGETFNLALRADGNTFTWGTASQSTFTNNSFGGFNGFTAIAAGSYHKLGLRSDGTVQASADSGSPLSFGYEQPPTGLSGVSAISAGYGHSLALKSNGTVVAWGINSSGVTNVPADLTNVSAIACGYTHDIALLSNGTVVAWGDNSRNQTNIPSGLSNVVAISSHVNHTLALKSDGTVVSWGQNFFGESSVPPGLTNVTAIAAGASSLALVGDSAACVSLPPLGLTLCLNSTARLQTAVCGTQPVACQWLHEGTNLPGATNLSISLSNFGVADAGSYALVASNTTGVVTSKWANLTMGPIAAWGSPNFEATLIPSGLTSPASIAAGFSWSAALDTNGNPFGWGNLPSSAPLPTNAAAFAAGPQSLLAVVNDGSVATWGASYATDPTAPPGLPPVSAGASGQYHRLALSTDGQVLAWGIPPSNSNYGQTNVPAGLNNIVAVAAGDNHSVALRRDGTVACWGSISNPPAGLSNVVAIAAGGSHSLALKADGTLTAWGTSDFGVNTLPAGLSNVVGIATSYFNSVAIKSDGSIVVWGNNFYGQISPPSFVHNVVSASPGWGHIVTIMGDGSPAFTVQPFNRFVTAGNSVTLQVMATGSAPLTYQWLFNGTNILGATNSTLTLPSLHLTSAGQYQCVISNSLGSATSSIANLTVLHPLLILSAQNNNDGSITLHVSGLDESGPVTLYSSTNLSDWTPIATNPPTFGAWDFSAPLTNAPLKFYRASQTQ